MLEQPPLPAKDAALEAANRPQTPVVEYHQVDQSTDFEPDLSKDVLDTKLINLSGFDATVERTKNNIDYTAITYDKGDIFDLLTGQSDIPNSAAWDINGLNAGTHFNAFDGAFNSAFGSNADLTFVQIRAVHRLVTKALRTGNLNRRGLTRYFEDSIVVVNNGAALTTINGLRSISNQAGLIILTPDSPYYQSFVSALNQARADLRGSDLERDVDSEIEIKVDEDGVGLEYEVEIETTETNPTGGRDRRTIEFDLDLDDLIRF